jgi:cyclopropane-fatty-acyl-phospholipid synthase
MLTQMGTAFLVAETIQAFYICVMSVAIELAERGLVPEPVIRMGIRRLLRSRIREESQRHADREAALVRFVRDMSGSEVAPVPALANRQHYEIPAAFFAQVLGARMKYSSGLWPEGVDTLDASEEAMLRLTAERAGVADGQRILELGCGWGSFTLWAAEHHPSARVVGVSNSASQRAFILEQARRRGLSNVEVVTADMNRFGTREGFDRVVSVEMFEHMRNWPELLRRIHGWLVPDGKLFVHVFAHARFAYLFQTRADDDWMGRHFFTGGMMPSEDLLPRVRGPFALEDRWTVPGTHYARTSEAWHARLLERADAATAALVGPLSEEEARLQVRRWRMFFLACAELFGFDAGRQWFVAHYLLSAHGGSR